MKWYIPDCFWPVEDHGSYVSHEAICILNTNDSPAEVSLTLYFEDRDEISGFHASVGARRTLHIRMDRIRNDDGEQVPRGVPYAVVVECADAITVQYTRVDTTQPSLTIATTVI